jgi:hypothetical protein
MDGRRDGRCWHEMGTADGGEICLQDALGRVADTGGNTISRISRSRNQGACTYTRRRPFSLGPVTRLTLTIAAMGTAT